MVALFSATMWATNSYWIAGYNGNITETWSSIHALTPSVDGNYEYFVAAAGNCEFKIYTSSAWVGGMGENNNQPGFNNTSIGNSGDGLTGSTWTDPYHNANYWYDNDDHDNYYILVYYPNTTVNTTDAPIICASTFLPNGKPSLYSVVGAAAICGSNWDVTDQNNDLAETATAGVYSITYPDIDLAATAYEFKLVKRHTWACGSYPANNYELNVLRSGKYDVTVTFTESSSAVTVDTTFKQAVVVLPTIQLGGLFDVWEAGYDFTPAENKLTASKTINFPKGGTGYSFKVIVDGTWKGLPKESETKAYTFHRGHTSASGWEVEVEDPYNGISAAYIWLDKAGDYTFTWTYETGTLAITYPELANSAVTIAAPAHGSITVKKGEDAVASGSNVEEFSTLTLTLSDNTEGYLFSNLRAYLTANPDSAIAITAGQLTMPGAAITITADEAARQLANGYYLVGTFGGVSAWDLADMSASKLFTINPDNDKEYKLMVDLAAGDQFKVRNVVDDAFVYYYPDGSDNNYVVTDDYAGNGKTIYFRPDGQGGAGWHYGVIYVDKNDATAIDNTVENGEVVKFIRDGQVLIIRDGKTYNVIGLEVR